MPSPDQPLTAMAWRLVPTCLYRGPRCFQERHTSAPVVVVVRLERAEARLHEATLPVP